MHVHKYKLRNTEFMGRTIRIRACKSCHETKEEFRLDIEKDGETITYILSKGSVLPHIYEAEESRKSLRNAVKNAKKRWAR